MELVQMPVPVEQEHQVAVAVVVVVLPAVAVEFAHMVDLVVLVEDGDLVEVADLMDTVPVYQFVLVVVNMAALAAAEEEVQQLMVTEILLGQTQEVDTVH